MIQCSVETKYKYCVRSYKSDTTDFVVKIKGKRKLKITLFLLTY